MNREQLEKYLYNQYSHYGKMECSIIKTRTPVNNLKVSVSLDHGASSLHFALLPVLLTLEETF